MPILMRLCVISLLTALSTTMVHAIGATLDEGVGGFIVDRLHDTRRLIAGPSESVPPIIEADQSCIELYQRRLILLRQLRDYNPTYWDDPRNQAAVLIGTIWAPAFYFLNYSAVNAQLDTLNHLDPQAELDALRHASAQRRCFEK